MKIQLQTSTAKIRVGSSNIFFMPSDNTAHLNNRRHFVSVRCRTKRHRGLMKHWQVKDALRRENEGKMEDEIMGDAPCSSLAVNSILRVGTIRTAGVIWGLCIGPYYANKLGLSGIYRTSFVAKSAGKFGIQCGLFAGVFSFTSCGIQRYQKQNDWVNALIGGAVAGEAIGSGNRNWKQVAGMAGLVAAFCAVANNSRTN